MMVFVLSGSEPTSSALCNVEMTKLLKSDPKFMSMYRINPQDANAMMEAFNGHIYMFYNKY
jgi:hypothetical protein